MIVTDGQRVAQYVAGKIGAGFGFAAYTGVGLERDGKLIAGVVYDYYNTRQVNAHIAADGNWASNREYLWFIFYYPFCQLGVERITAPVAMSNLKACRLAERLGFVKEAVMERASPKGDVAIYRMFIENCRWLEVRNVCKQ